jgi:hypothetical protein
MGRNKAWKTLKDETANMEHLGLGYPTPLYAGKA